jgi:hypothetical protein
MVTRSIVRISAAVTIFMAYDERSVMERL